MSARIQQSSHQVPGFSLMGDFWWWLWSHYLFLVCWSFLCPHGPMLVVCISPGIYPFLLGFSSSCIVVHSSRWFFVFLWSQWLFSFLFLILFTLVFSLFFLVWLNFIYLFNFHKAHFHLVKLLYILLTFFHLFLLRSLLLFFPCTSLGFGLFLLSSSLEWIVRLFIWSLPTFSILSCILQTSSQCSLCYIP